MSDQLPSQAKIVIVGAGAIGCSIAMHLARAGERDVVVLEKNAITHGSTWHAAGLVGQYRSAEDLTRLMQASVEAMNEIQAETPIDWHPVGSLQDRVFAGAARRIQSRRAGRPALWRRLRGDRCGRGETALSSRLPRRALRALPLSPATALSTRRA